jgi:hypothetical protein
MAKSPLDSKPSGRQTTSKWFELSPPFLSLVQQSLPQMTLPLVQALTHPFTTPSNPVETIVEMDILC